MKDIRGIPLCLGDMIVLHSDTGSYFGITPYSVSDIDESKHILTIYQVMFDKEFPNILHFGKEKIEAEVYRFLIISFPEGNPEESNEGH